MQILFYFRRHQIHGLDHTEVHRENLREMLSKMRKDPLDDDLEKCDGEYFPCEFCEYFLFLWTVTAHTILVILWFTSALK